MIYVALLFIKVFFIEKPKPFKHGLERVEKGKIKSVPNRRNGSV